MLHHDASAAATGRARVYGDQVRSSSCTWPPPIVDWLTEWHSLGRTRCALENAMLAFAVIAILCVAVESELIWTDIQRDDWLLSVKELSNSSSGVIPQQPPTFSAAFQVLKCVLSASTLALVVALVLRYRIVCQSLIETKQLAPQTKFFHTSSGLLGYFAVELLVCAFHIPPFVSTLLTLQWQRDANFYLDQLDVLVFLRVYLVGRFLRNWLGFDSSSYTVQLIVHVLLRKNKGTFHRVDVLSIWFTIKYAFQKFPFLSTTVALLVDWILTSAALNFVERGLTPFFLFPVIGSGTNDRLTNINEAVWLTIVTMTSVGYGEVAPRTLGGKLTIVFGAIVGGTIFTCLLRVVLIDALLVTPQEKIVLDVVYFHEFIRKQKEAAAFLIQQTWKCHRDQQNHNQESKYKHRVYGAAEAFRLLRFTQPSSSFASLNSSSAVVASSSLTNATSKQLEHFQEQMKSRRARSMHALHATTQLFRNIAETSSE
ncbi:Voltage-gated ion channel, partial [Globisporangium splendens]